MRKYAAFSCALTAFVCMMLLSCSTKFYGTIRYINESGSEVTDIMAEGFDGLSVDTLPAGESATRTHLLGETQWPGVGIPTGVVSLSYYIGDSQFTMEQCAGAMQDDTGIWYNNDAVIMDGRTLVVTIKADSFTVESVRD